MRIQCVIPVSALLLAAGLSGQTLKIVVQGQSEATLAAWRAASSQVSIEAAKPGKADFLAQVADADAIFGEFPPDVFAAARKLKWVQIYSAGAERILYPEFKRSGVLLTNCKVLQGPNIADHALALLLALTRGTGMAAKIREKEEWDRNAYNLIELNGKTALVVGVGGIGTQIAQRAHAFGMRVIGVDPKEIPYTYMISKVVRPERIDTVIGEADVVFVSAPHTPESENMIGPRQFELMKKGAYFVAVSRGKLYNHEALAKALDSRHLSGAGLDVTYPEPLPKGHALWKFDNVIITPHIAGQSDRVQQRRVDLIADNIRRWVAGEPMVNVVDKAKGF
ncbi:MAG: D-2-hydroxyacid dehydrogenase [Acidobacteria bacterium]|nr:D-2-hydroxyacid dehydrogenase [Acidobacteriota bacterium]